MKTLEKAIINFAYFTYNFPYNFIELCWENDNIINHLKNKLSSYAQNGVISSKDFIRFFLELDRENQIKLAEWININYKGI